jgi:Trk K+ transport system NAD-binding subunit
MKTVDSKSTLDAVLVCGLGSLGQSCVSVLKGFGVTVYAVDLIKVQYWDIPTMSNLLDGFWVGDCRQSQVLEQAKIQDCRAILLLTGNDRVNLNAAFAARVLNPNVRLIVRSQQENLNSLLSKHLGNFIAFEPTQLTAPAIALAGLRDETLGFFQLDHHLFRVTQEKIAPNHAWIHQRQLHKLNTLSRRLLSHTRSDDSRPDRIYEWEPNALIQAGDRITYLEITHKLASFSDGAIESPYRKPAKLTLISQIQSLRRQLKLKWRSLTQTERVALSGIPIMLGLVGLCTLLYLLQYPNISFQDALNVSLVLILGGYDNLFGQLKLPFPIPVWLHAFSFGLTLFGTLFIGILFALLTERVFSARMVFLRPRPPIPTANHVVIIGLDGVGQQVASLLQSLKHPCVGIHSEPLESGAMPHLPLVVDALREALPKVNLSTARSAMILTDDEMTNLEIGLMVQAINPHCPLVLRTSDSQFGSHIVQLLPNAKAFSVDALAAEVFAAAAFGENILSLLHVNRQTLLLTEYRVETGDTLSGRLIAEVAYGYCVAPILHQRNVREPEKLLPSDDIKLQVGDRLIVLATLTSLKNIEHGRIAQPTWQVRVEKALFQDSIFDGIATISRISDCDLGMSKSLMARLPATLSTPLYRQQAQRLIYELSKVQILAYESSTQR